jgi:hypothetical protein
MMWRNVGEGVKGEGAKRGYKLADRLIIKLYVKVMLDMVGIGLEVVDMCMVWKV